MANEAQINIALIQPDLASVEDIKEVLHSFWKNFKVDMVVDVNLALDFVQHRNVYRNSPIPDLVILDLDLLNRMHENCKNILWYPGFRLIPFILLCNGRCSENERIFQVPVYEVEKPLTFEKIAQIFGRFLASGMMEKQM